MKNINFKKSVMVCALSLGSISAANAAEGTFDVGFRTITDVTIVETQALSFGATMFATSGGVCSMDASAATVSDVQAGINGGADGSTAGLIAGTGCIDQAAATTGNQIGIYTVSGISGADVKVTVNEVLGAEFDFTPDSGCISNYDGSSGGDTCQSFFPGTAVTTALANSTEGTADSEVTDTELRVVIGGKITVNTDLTSDTNYTQQFTIVATY